MKKKERKPSCGFPKAFQWGYLCCFEIGLSYGKAIDWDRQLRQQQRWKFFSFQIWGGKQLLQLFLSDLNTYYSDQESNNVLCLSLKNTLIKTVPKLNKQNNKSKQLIKLQSFSSGNWSGLILAKLGSVKSWIIISVWNWHCCESVLIFTFKQTFACFNPTNIKVDFNWCTVAYIWNS